MLNWFSPFQASPKGRTFNLTAGRAQGTYSHVMLALGLFSSVLNLQPGSCTVSSPVLPGHSCSTVPLNRMSAWNPGLGCHLAVAILRSAGLCAKLHVQHLEGMLKPAGDWHQLGCVGNSSKWNGTM